MRDGERDRARPGAQIEHAQVPVLRQPRERELDQRLRFRARDEHRGRHLQCEPPELARAGEIRDGLAVAAAPGEAEERVRLAARDNASSPMRDQPRAVTAEHVRQQHLRVERNEAGLRERATHRDVPAHRFGFFGDEEPQPLIVVAAPAGILESRLHQHALRRLVARMGDADDPIEAEVVETVVDERLRAFGRETPAPGLRQEPVADFDVR